MWVEQSEYKVVGLALEGARRQAGLSQQELAARLSKPQSFVSNYESGQRRIDVLELVRIANALGCDASKLFDQIRLQSGPRGRRRKVR